MTSTCAIACDDIFGGKEDGSGNRGTAVFRGAPRPTPQAQAKKLVAGIPSQFDGTGRQGASAAPLGPSAGVDFAFNALDSVMRHGYGGGFSGPTRIWTSVVGPPANSQWGSYGSWFGFGLTTVGPGAFGALERLTVAGVEKGLAAAAEKGAVTAIEVATDTAAKAAEKGGDILYHGSDLASVESIVANGLNRDAAGALGGGDLFWTTADLAIARWFGRANPAGSAASGVVGIRLPGTIAEAEAAGLIARDKTGAWVVENWAKFNDAVKFFRVE